MDMENGARRKRGRPPKAARAVHRYCVRLDEEENARLEMRFLKSGMRYRSCFIKKCVLEGRARITCIDPAVMDFYIRLTHFRAQFAAVGRNYNQVVEDTRRKFGDRRAAAMLRRVQDATVQLVILFKGIEKLTREYRERYTDLTPEA